VMQWAESRREQQPAHKPVRCLEGQEYRTLWTMAGGNRSCNESKITEPVVERDREFTTDLEVDISITSKVTAPHVKTSPGTTFQPVIETAVTSEVELRSAPESEKGGWASLLSWIFIAVTFFLILPITFGVAMFLSLMVVNYIVKRVKDHRTQQDIQKKIQPRRSSLIQCASPGNSANGRYYKAIRRVREPRRLRCRWYWVSRV
jgi:hypothetical protein